MVPKRSNPRSKPSGRKPKARPARSRAPRRSQTSGDRIVRAPAAIGRVSGSGLSGNRVPVMRSSGRNMTVTHTERFATVTTSATTLESRTFPLNPGLSTCFPWLSDVANRYEKYKFRALDFVYVPQAAAAAGSVSLIFDFDPNDAAPVTMELANTYHDYVTTSIWNGAHLRPDIANGDRLPQKNTRPGLPGSDIDLNVYDVGNLYCLTSGAASGVIGYLEVNYVVDLFIHQVQNGVGGAVTCSSGLDGTNLFGYTQEKDADGYIPLTFTSSAMATFAQPYEGVVCFEAEGVALTANFAPVAAGGAVTTVLDQIVNAGGTHVTGFFSIRAYTGQTITPTMTVGTSLASIKYQFGRGSYASYN